MHDVRKPDEKDIFSEFSSRPTESVLIFYV